MRMRVTLRMRMRATLRMRVSKYDNKYTSMTVYADEYVCKN